VLWTTSTRFIPPAWEKANLESVWKIGAFEFFEQDTCPTDGMRDVFAAE
jgi:hypothetical protein